MVVGIEIRFDLARDDQRRARFVDQHAVGLVHDGEMQAAQPQLPGARGVAVHRLQLQGEIAVGLAEQDAVAQIVEGELLVGAIGDVARIGGAPLLGALAAEHDPDRETEPSDRARPSARHRGAPGNR